VHRRAAATRLPGAHDGPQSVQRSVGSRRDIACDEGLSDETLWTDPDTPSLPAYRKSKTLAERAAWAFMETANGPTTLTTVLPGAVFGPILDTDNRGSVQVIGRLLRGRMPGTPRIGLEVVDVRDIADVHIRAMTAPSGPVARFTMLLISHEPRAPRTNFCWFCNVGRL